MTGKYPRSTMLLKTANKGCVTIRINIAICDDAASEAAYLEQLITTWAQRKKQSVSISVYESAEAFLFTYEENKSIDILLLDIQMKKMNGISLAKRLRAEGARLQIVFVTGHTDFIAEGYEVSALHYLVKPVKEDKLHEVLSRALETLEYTEPYLLVHTTEGQARILHREIQYIEAFAHATAVHTAKNSYNVKAPISELEDSLKDGFFRCHRSYLVGLRYIQQITRTNVILDNSKTLPLSRKSYEAVNNAFIGFYRRNRG